MKLKDEIKKTIGQTEQSKARAWQKLDQPKRSNKIPLYISLAATVIACLLIALQFAPQNKQEHAVTLEAPSETMLTLPFELIYDQDGSSFNVEFYDDNIVLTAYTQEELDRWLHYLEIDIPELNFDQHFVVIAMFRSDGCGLVVKEMSRQNDTLDIVLDLPEELRNEKDLKFDFPEDLREQEEIFCTAISMPNIQILQLQKFDGANDLTKATFNGTKTTVNINELQINDQHYNFGLAEDYIELEKIVVKDLYDSRKKIVEDEKSLEIISNSIFRAEKIPGMLNIADYHYKLNVHHKNGDTLTILLAVDTKEPQVIFVSEKNTEQGFLLTDEYADKLIQLLQQ